MAGQARGGHGSGRGEWESVRGSPRRAGGCRGGRLGRGESHEGGAGGSRIGWHGDRWLGWNALSGGVASSATRSPPNRHSPSRGSYLRSPSPPIRQSGIHSPGTALGRSRPATLQSPARVRLRLLADNVSLRHCRQPPCGPVSSPRHHPAPVSPEQLRGGTPRQERARHQARQRCAAPTHSIPVHMKLTLSRRPDMSPLTHPGRLSPRASPLPAAAHYTLTRKLPATQAAPDAPARTRATRDRLQALAQRALQEGRCV